VKLAKLEASSNTLYNNASMLSNTVEGAADIHNRGNEAPDNPAMN
jgi:hypothetical protein